MKRNCPTQGQGKTSQILSRWRGGVSEDQRERKRERADYSLDDAGDDFVGGDMGVVLQQVPDDRINVRDRGVIVAHGFVFGADSSAASELGAHPTSGTMVSPFSEVYRQIGRERAWRGSEIRKSNKDDDTLYTA
jgi:hypothetical protein